mgnify:CR=1 FL=1
MLSELQRQTLLDKTRRNWSQADISAWLTQECGLSHRAAHTERNWAIKIVSDEKAKEPQPDPLEEARRKEAEAQALAQKKADYLRRNIENRNPKYEYSVAHPELKCDSCGDETFYCDCTCKRTTDIPF